MSRRGWAFFLAMSVIWGLPYLMIRVAVRQLDPGVLVFLRTAPAALLLFPIVLAQRQLPTLWRNLKWITIFAVIEFGIPWYLMARAEEKLTSSLTSLIIAAVPLLSVVVVKARRGDEHVSARRYLGLGVGAAGVAFLVGLDLSGGQPSALLCMLFVLVGYTIGPILLAGRLRDVPGPTIVFGATAVVALGWIPWDLGHLPARVDAETWECVAVLSVVCTAGAFLTFFELVKEVGASRSVVVTYVNTAIAVVLGIVGLHEPLTTGIVIGFPLVIVGSIVATGGARPALAT